MKIFRSLAIALALLIAQTNVNAAVTGIKYKLVYNPSTCLYNVYMFITSGNTATIQEQEAYTAQVSIVVPTGTFVGVTGIISNEPKIGTYANNVLTRSTATNWYNSNKELNNPALAGSDVYSFVPNLTNAYYGNLNANDSVLLFSLPISVTDCATGLRLWNNNEIQGLPVAGGDPAPAGFGGLDYNNGHNFSANTLYQAYSGNAVSRVTPPKPNLSLAVTYVTGTKFADTSTASAGSSCASPLSYSWTGPNSFSSTSPHILINPITSQSFGTYTLTVTDAKGCSTSASSQLTSGTPLDLRLISFDGVGIKCTAFLNWKISSGTKFYKFFVQFSEDGITYKVIDEIYSANNAGRTKFSSDYLQNGKNGFYRIVIADDADGLTTGPSVYVATHCEGREILVSPNPTPGEIVIRGIELGDEIKVTNMDGRAILRQIAMDQMARVDISQFANGIYNVQVLRNQILQKTVRVVKK